ncbi:MAG: hypothetical protein EBU90_00245 [Proteobacteria bacterium]|nr:hypothetical protein [Pseudomonadota bacterium]NBP12862.1 hypothetical protein [bacterium]
MKKKKDKKTESVVSESYTCDTNSTFPVSYSITTNAIGIDSVKELDQALSNINDSIDKVSKSTNEALEALLSVQQSHRNMIQTNHSGLQSLAELVFKHNECLANHQELHEKTIDVITKDGKMLNDLYKKYFNLVFNLQVAFFVNSLVIFGIVGYLIFKK